MTRGTNDDDDDDDDDDNGANFNLSFEQTYFRGIKHYGGEQSVPFSFRGKKPLMT